MAMFATMVVLIALLATVVASVLAGNAPEPWITVSVTIVVLGGMILAGRWLWRSGRAVGGLIDAADRVASGELGARAPTAGGRSLSRLTGSFNQMAEQLETNERRRRELLADIAHELRTPLQAMRGSVEGMLDGVYPVDPERLRSVVAQTQTMARLLDDLRTLSMAEAGVLELHPEPMDPRAAVEHTLETFGVAARDAGVRVQAVIDDDLPVTIDADPVRVREVLANLVTNALRHTPRDGVVTVSVAPAAGVVRFEVTDTGPGIPPAERAAVFDRFVTSADAGGTGLGLAIAKRIVQAHGGAIEATDAPGGGTAMRVDLPIGDS
jgi:two-component system sensor histidine kinase BaeS